MNDKERILLYDIVWLYPSAVSNDGYPIGRSEIIPTGFDDVRNYFGLISCKVLPPGKCLYSVLPAKISGKLVFAVCRVCADTGSRGICDYSDEVREMEGVWTKPELHHALDVRHTLSDVYEFGINNLEKKAYLRIISTNFLKIRWREAGGQATKTARKRRHSL